MAALWDDSALIKAFDSAMTKYKEMHGFSGKTKPCQRGMARRGEVENTPSSCLTNDRMAQCEMRNDEVLEDDEAIGVETQVKAAVSEQSNTCQQQNLAEPNFNLCEHNVPESLSLPYGAEGSQPNFPEQEHQHLLRQIQQLECQQQQMYEQLSYLTSAGHGVGNTFWNASAHDSSSGLVYPAYPPVGGFYSPYPPCAYSSGHFAPWQHGMQPQDASAASNSNRARSCMNCGSTGVTSSAASMPCSNDLLDSLRLVVTEAMKIASINNKPAVDPSPTSRNQCEEKHHSGLSDLSDVTMAWFLAGFHTARYLTVRDSAQ
eukprot:c24064_g1_i1 orf=403-1353(-)